MVENRAAHPCSPSNVHPIEPDRLLHLSLHITPYDFRYTRATGREACPDGLRLEGRGFEVAGSDEKCEAAGGGRLRRLPS